MKHTSTTWTSRARFGGFTLVELLVVISIIGLLLAILAPSLLSAKEQGRAILCATNMRTVGIAVMLYTNVYSAYPASYLYPYNADGDYDLTNQPPAHEYGYLHWSYFLYDHGKEATPKMFQCPGSPTAGAPRTNPGPDSKNWEASQVDQNGQSQPNELKDKQAPRISFVANAAIMPRNKFTRTLSGGQRVNKLVGVGQVDTPNSTILVAEVGPNWKGVGVASGCGVLSKSHRPVSPFYHLSSGNNEYAAPLGTPGFVYGPPDDRKTFGLKPLEMVDKATGLIDGAVGTELNAIGRHHPGPEDKLGRSANFLFGEGHVERKTVLQTILCREWGERYYSITGANEVLP